MKTNERIRLFLTCMMATLCMVSCGMLVAPEDADIDSGEGNIGLLCLKFRDTGSYGGETRGVSSTALPDTNAFILTVKNSRGTILYSGRYDLAPENFLAEEGSYEICVVSENFSGIAFDDVQWGDEQCISVKSGSICNVELVCRQMNSGLKLRIDPAFLSAYPNAVLFVKNSEGKLMYGYRETRTVFFNPGNVQIVMSGDDGDKTLLSRNISSGEILNMSIKVADNPAQPEDRTSSMKISIDTTRTYTSESFTIGEEASSKGNSAENALTIAQAKTSIGSKGVWVAGYIVGGDLTSKNMSTEAPFSSPSCLAIGPKANTTSKESCISVSLTSGTTVRSELNLVENPDMFGKYVVLQGDIVSSYFGIVGLKNVTSYVSR